MPKGGKTGKTGKSHRRGYTSKGLQDFPAFGASGKMGKVRGKRRQYYWLTFPAFPLSFLVGIRANPLLSRLTACHFPTFPTFPLFKNIYNNYYTDIGAIWTDQTMWPLRNIAKTCCRKSQAGKNKTNKPAYWTRKPWIRPTMPNVKHW